MRVRDMKIAAMAQEIEEKASATRRGVAIIAETQATTKSLKNS